MKSKKKNLQKVESILEKNSIYFDKFGVTQEKNVVLKDKLNVTVDELIKTNKTWLREFMGN